MIPKISIELTLKKLFFSILTIYLISLIAYFLFDYRLVVDISKKDSSKISNISSLQVNSVFQQVSNILLIIDSKISAEKMNQLETSLYLSTMNLLISDIETINLLDNNNVTTASSNDTYLGYKYPKQFQGIKLHESKNNQIILRENEKSLISNEQTVSFTYRRLDTRLNIMGIIKAHVPPSLWYKYFKDQLLNPNDEISILNLRDCEILGSSTFYDKFVISKYVNSDICRRIGQKKYSNTYIDQSTGHIISYTTLPQFNIATISVVSRNSYFLPFVKKTIIVVILSIVVFFSFWQLIKRQLDTERKLNDESILRSHASKMASVGEMASGIAHEINNPLGIATGMISQAQKVLKKMNNPDLASLEKILNTTSFSIERIAKIVKGMKVISRQSESDAYEKISLETIMNNSTIFYQEKLKNKNTDLSIDPIPKVALLCNETQISQIFINLVGNSSDAIENLEEKWIKISFQLEEKENKLKIFFTDSGKGIPKEVADKIMQPFFTTKAVGQGTGLGLTIINKIITEHMGTFELNQDSPNTQFVVTLKYEPIDE